MEAVNRKTDAGDWRLGQLPEPNSRQPRTAGLGLLQKYLLAISVYLLALVMWGLPFVFSDPVLVALLLSVPFLVAYAVIFWLHQIRFNDIFAIVVAALVPMLVAGLFWADVTDTIYERYFDDLPPN